MTSPNQYALSQLQILEAESIHIIREVVAQMERPALLFSGGKDSIVLLHLAMKAFHPAPIPFPIVHVDTGHNFPEVLEFRDSIVEKHGIRLVVGSVHRARREHEVAVSRRRIILNDVGTSDVRRHQVRGELDPAELEVEHPGHGVDEKGLRQPRHPYDKAVAPHE